MTLPQVGTPVNYYWKTGTTTPAVVQNVDDIGGKLIVSYISPAPLSLSFPTESIVTSPWSSQGTGVGQWEPTS
jgi:hypothetical protein